MLVEQGYDTTNLYSLAWINSTLNNVIRKSN